MSSRPLLVLMALTSILVLPGTASQIQTGDTVTDLLRQDEILKAESLLDKQPPSPQSTAQRGEIEFRRGNFQKAESRYKAALGADSTNARAHFGLGKLALAKLRIKEAIQLFTKAVELDPKESLYRLYASEAWGGDKNTVEQRKQLAAYLALEPVDPDRLAEARAGIEMLDAFKGTEIGEIVAPSQPEPVPFRPFLNLIFADVMVNDQGPFNFVIDSGASQTVFSESLANKLGLTPVTTTIIHGVGGLGKIESKIFRADEIAFGDVKVRNLPVGTFNDAMVSQLADGIMGTAMLSDFVVTVNYPENRVELTREVPKDDAGMERVPAWYFNNLLLIELELNGHRGNFIVDTGAVTTVLSQTMASALGVDENTPGAKVSLPLGGVGGLEGTILQVPDVTIKTASSTQNFERLVAIDLKSISKMIGTEVSGVIGYDFLETYKLTLDYSKVEVRLSK